MKEEQKHPTLEEINSSYDSYQEDLQTRDLHLRLLVSFDDSGMDDILSLIKESYREKNEP